MGFDDDIDNSIDDMFDLDRDGSLDFKEKALELDFLMEDDEDTEGGTSYSGNTRTSGRRGSSGTSTESSHAGQSTEMPHRPGYVYVERCFSDQFTSEEFEEMKRKNDFKALILIAVILGVAALAYYIPEYFFSDVTWPGSQCAAEGCTNEHLVFGSFCAKHTCDWPHCNNYSGDNGSVYCDEHAKIHARREGYRLCFVEGCYAPVYRDGLYCQRHDHPISYTPSTTKKETTSTTNKKNDQTSNHSTTGSSSSKKTYDAYDVYDYDSAQDFADDRYEEFFDYEDYYEDEDEAYDAAEDYWREMHGVDY